MKGLARITAIGVLLLGVAGLVFGILLVVAGSTTRSETVNELKADKSPTTEISQLRAIRDNLRDLRWDLDEPPQDPTNQNSLNVLVLETGTGLTLTNLGLATMITFAGIGTMVMGVALVLVGFTQYRMSGHMT